MDDLLARYPALHDALADDALWVLVRVGTQRLVLPTAPIVEMVRTPPVHHVPHLPVSVRGVATLRGEVGALIDLRVRFGMASARSEQEAVIALLHAREKDHRDWVDDLEASVQEQRPFTRTLDPHACAFGKWYDHYKAPTPELEWFLPRFAEPHAAIHATGATIAGHMAHGRHLAAAEIVADMKATLFPRLLGLFERARHIVATATTEIAVVVRLHGQTVGLLVDDVESICHVKPDSLAALAGSSVSRDAAVVGTARTQEDDALVVAIDPDTLVRDFASAA